MAVVVAPLFLPCLFLTPLAGTVPAFAAAPTLLFVPCMMARGIAELNWVVADYAPALVTALAMPFTVSIATGIALGFIIYAAVKLLSRRFSAASPAVLLLALAFILRFAFL